jgi:hypothetical protein
MKHIKEFIIFLSLFFSNYIFSQQPNINTIENNRNLILNSKWVTDLQPGFKAESGTTFKAEIKNCY